MSTALSPDAVLTDRAAYLERRGADRERIMALRARRRVRLGDQLVLEFENAETLLYQVQEMVFCEGISDRADVEYEIWAYGRNLPTSHEVGATMFVELDDVATVKEELARLTGVQHALYLSVDGERASGVELPGPDEDGPSPITMSVHFVRFHLTDSQLARFCDPNVPCRLGVDHPEYVDETPLTGEVRAELIADLRGAATSD